MHPRELSVCCQFAFPSPRRRLIPSQGLKTHFIFLRAAHVAIRCSPSRLGLSELFVMSAFLSLWSWFAAVWVVHAGFAHMRHWDGTWPWKTCQGCRASSGHACAPCKCLRSCYWDSAKLLRSTVRLSSESLDPHLISQASQKCLDRRVSARPPCLPCERTISPEGPSGQRPA